MTNPQPTMADLYPGGKGYHKAHQPYMAAVATALNAAGFTNTGGSAEANDPRDGFIELDLEQQGTIDGRPIWSHDEVGVCWQEERGWWVLTVDEFDEPQRSKRGWETDKRHVYELGVATIASPVTVVLAVAEKAGLTLELDDDGHPDVDFPEHEIDTENVPLELALRHYAEAAKP